MEKGKIVAVNISTAKGTRKTGVNEIYCSENHGFEGDAHAGAGLRQVSLLSLDSIEKTKKKGFNTGPGDFAENLTVSGMDFSALKTGVMLQAGGAKLRITQLGKKCHAGCDIFKNTGDCIMPKEGIFAGVIASGRIKKGDSIEVIADDKSRDTDNK